MSPRLASPPRRQVSRLPAHTWHSAPVRLTHRARPFRNCRESADLAWPSTQNHTSDHDANVHLMVQVLYSAPAVARFGGLTHPVLHAGHHLNTPLPPQVCQFGNATCGGFTALNDRGYLQVALQNAGAIAAAYTVTASTGHAASPARPMKPCIANSEHIQMPSTPTVSSGIPTVPTNCWPASTAGECAQCGRSMSGARAA